MRLKVLGCYGAELPGFRSPGFLINDDTLLDAGTVVSVLTLEEQIRIKNILISHTHLDHIKDIQFLADNVTGRGGTTINIMSAPTVLDSFKAHVLNDSIWPDFTMITSGGNAVLRLVPVDVGSEYPLGDVIIKPVKVNHSVPAVGYIIKNSECAFAYTGDTGVTDEIWEEAGREPNLKFVITEVSFPNSMEGIANTSKHMTPHDLGEVLKRLNRKDVRIYVMHMKPQYMDIIKGEIAMIARSSSYIIGVLTVGEVIEL